MTFSYLSCALSRLSRLSRLSAAIFPSRVQLQASAFLFAGCLAGILASWPQALAATSPATPTFSLAAGTYNHAIDLALSDKTAGAAIHYTTDGTAPTVNSPVYSRPILVGIPETIRAIAVASGSTPSAVVSAVYTIAYPVAEPRFSIPGGTFSSPQTVAITDSQAGAVIYYTANGQTPTSASTLYTGPIRVGSTEIVKAIATAHGLPNSVVALASYVIQQAVATPATPAFSLAAGTYNHAIDLALSDKTAGAAIHYTTDGTAPTVNSPVYSRPILVGIPETIRAIAVASGSTPSAVASAVYTIAYPVTEPRFSIPGGTFSSPQTVAITDSQAGAAIYYTANGQTPTSASTLYTGPIRVGSTEIVKAIATAHGLPNSVVASASYVIQSAAATAATPTFSLAAGAYPAAITVGIGDATSGATIYYTTNGTTPTTASSVYSAALPVNSTTTLKAIAAYPGESASPVASSSYTIRSESTPVHSPNSTKTFFGANVSGLLNGTPWPEVPVGTLRLLTGATNWNYVNPASGTYDWESLDHEISLAQANGAKLLYTFSGTPPWAIPTGLTISAISRSGGVVTVTTAEPHNLYYNPEYLPDWQTSVRISGVADSRYNGTFGLTGTPTATTLTYAQAGLDSSSNSGTLSATCGGNMAPSACAEAPQSLKSWDTFVSALIDHVGPGVIQYWELWNEPNIQETWHGTQSALVAMAVDARAILKKADPNAVILSPGTTINFETPAECATKDPRCGSHWLSQWLAAGGKNTIDGLAFHGYPQVGEGPEQIQGVVGMQQLAMNENGLGSLPIFDTESSWGLNTKLPIESVQVAFVARHFLLEHSMGVQGSFWFSYDSSTWGTMWSSKGGLNAVGEAELQVSKWIVGSTLTQPCAAMAADPTTYTCAYSRPGGYTALAVWNTAGETAFGVLPGLVQYHDLSGNVTSLPGGTAEISTSPILLENKSAF
jgi:Chitobiase/beta-hexosaminidase C-terminal domain